MNRGLAASVIAQVAMMRHERQMQGMPTSGLGLVLQAEEYDALIEEISEQYRLWRLPEPSGSSPLVVMDVPIQRFPPRPT